MSMNTDFSAWRATEIQTRAFVESTNLVPVVVLDGVVAELCAFFKADAQTEELYNQMRSEAVVNYIAGRSALCWQNNSHFRVLMQEDDPRPTYHAFVRHWVAGILKERFSGLYSRLPSDFSTGAPLTQLQM
jgi:hypothetical protein